MIVSVISPKRLWLANLTPVTHGAICNQLQDECLLVIAITEFNLLSWIRLNFKLGKSKFSALINGKTSKDSAYWWGISEPSKICSHLIVFKSASDWLNEKSLKFCPGGHGSCSRTVSAMWVLANRQLQLFACLSYVLGLADLTCCCL